MDYVTLGRTGLQVSRICLGCMSYGQAKTPGIIEWHDLRDRTERRVQEDHLSVFAHDAHDGEKESREDSK